MSDTDTLLKVLIELTGRLAFSEEQVRAAVCKGGASAKQVDAYNLCDGTLSQAEIAKRLRLDAGNFSTTLKRWMTRGIVHRVGTGKDSRLLHVFPLSSAHRVRTGRADAD